MARLKVRTEGRFSWMRTIGSALVGEGADPVIFISVAFLGELPLPGLGTASAPRI